jgi:hypothetical protein
MGTVSSRGKKPMGWGGGKRASCINEGNMKTFRR